VLTDNLPDSLTFVSGSPGCINSGNTVTCNAGTLASGGTTNFVVNVAASSAGLVTNAVTVSSTTANANLTNSTVVSVIRVLVSPNVSGLSSSGFGMTLSLTTVPGLTYTLEYKTGLNDPTWTPLPPAVTATGTSLTLQDTNTQVGSRFYRVLCQ
jgi:hypothetical protein